MIVVRSTSTGALVVVNRPFLSRNTSWERLYRVGCFCYFVRRGEADNAACSCTRQGASPRREQTAGAPTPPDVNIPWPAGLHDFAKKDRTSAIPMVVVRQNNAREGQICVNEVGCGGGFAARRNGAGAGAVLLSNDVFFPAPIE
jgi:hypothetical protein